MTHHQRTRTLFTRSLGVVAAVIALAACGGGGDPGASSDGSPDQAPAEATRAPVTESEGPVDVCGLLDTADIEAAFASPFAAGEATHHAQTGGDQCTWSNTDAPPVKVFSITVDTDDGLADTFGQTAAELFQLTRDFADDPVDRPLGDDAFVDAGSLHVLDGSRYLTFLVSGTSGLATSGLDSLAATVVQ